MDLARLLRVLMIAAVSAYAVPAHSQFEGRSRHRRSAGGAAFSSETGDVSPDPGSIDSGYRDLITRGEQTNGEFMTDRNYVLIVAASGDEATAAADFTNYDAVVKALNEGDEKIDDANNS
ncbi:MAG: hypothetical protein ABW091_01695 [Microbacterium sp.]